MAVLNFALAFFGSFRNVAVSYVENAPNADGADSGLHRSCGSPCVAATTFVMKRKADAVSEADTAPNGFASAFERPSGAPRDAKIVQR